jgi:hypothetical protein
VDRLFTANPSFVVRYPSSSTRGPLRTGGNEPDRILRVQETVTAVEIIMDSLEPNADTTIDEV